MAAGDGDGWAQCELGHRHWGVFGAAGLLVHHRAPDGTVHILLQHRARWSHNGGTWGVLGGARDSHESAVATALRESTEEAALDADAVRIEGIVHDEHGGWSYDTVLASAQRLLPARAINLESRSVDWVPLADVPNRKLHPGFAETWPSARTALRRAVLLIDAANVVGARPDGWWRDRAGAAARLRDVLSDRLTTGLPGTLLPAGVELSVLDRWYPEAVLVVEGAARGIADAAGVRVLSAPGSGDDTIVAEATGRGPDEQVIVVTADRELRDRCTATGAVVLGPGRLLSLIDGG